jgi:predicted  nucleic acid-binding Zn-ribbon protein
MTDIVRDLHVLKSIAKLDASINSCRQDLARLPVRLDQIKKALAGIESRESESKETVADLDKERRTLEQGIEDNAAKITKFKTQLMEVKNNKEYTAMLHEIQHFEKDTGDKEERLLILMDEQEQQSEGSKDYLEQSGKEKQVLKQEQAQLEAKIKSLEAEVEKLAGEKPKLLREINPQIKKRYDRVLAKLGDYAVTHVVGDTCQGCFTRIPPQIAVEIRKDEQLIACEACGRMLVHYNAEA